MRFRPQKSPRTSIALMVGGLFVACGSSDETPLRPAGVQDCSGGCGGAAGTRGPSSLGGTSASLDGGAGGSLATGGVAGDASEGGVAGEVPVGGVAGELGMGGLLDGRVGGAPSDATGGEGGTSSGSIDPLQCARDELTQAAEDGSLTADIEPSCGDSLLLCCPGGTPVVPCGPLHFDLVQRGPDKPPLVLTDVPREMRIDAVMRARLTTVMSLPITLPGVGNCAASVDSISGSFPDVTISIPLTRSYDAVDGLPRLDIGLISIQGLNDGDVSLDGGLVCQLANLGLASSQSLVTQLLASALEQRLCSVCSCTDP